MIINIYQSYLKNKDLITGIYQYAHDSSIHDALFDLMEGKTAISFMGGHGEKRNSDTYRKIVLLARKLAQEGFLIATGGGPGAMEAANLGAYLMGVSDEDCEKALQLISSDLTEIDPAQMVINEFGYPTNAPSLGIPTWLYGHEPSNKFATWHAKYFSNAIRENDLIILSNGGIIYNQGSAGTRQEIFQDACRNHYAKENESCPMVFFDEEFWKRDGVFQIVEKTSEGCEYHDLLLCTDSVGDIVQHFVNYRTSRNLPSVADMSSY
eukprot:TRINITY_DN3821_c0_g1_i1.p1 TRINITY_DN3821_c0_g1~~TRINITY_DN3821_c0_g1_i1.p1  ORF type:complete len:266 (+),score=57.60 TRINITY_DN3821_c0_g1_i1:742-1539(+)